MITIGVPVVSLPHLVRMDVHGSDVTEIEWIRPIVGWDDDGDPMTMDPNGSLTAWDVRTDHATDRFRSFSDGPSAIAWFDDGVRAGTIRDCRIA
jgi:hypothetical protein